MLSPTSSKERLNMTAHGISTPIRDLHGGDLFADDATGIAVAGTYRELGTGLTIAGFTALSTGIIR